MHWLTSNRSPTVRLCWLCKYSASKRKYVSVLYAQLWADKSDKVLRFLFKTRKKKTKQNQQHHHQQKKKKHLSVIHTHQIKWTVKRNAPGTTKSSEPTDHRRRNTIKPGIWKCNFRKWNDGKKNESGWNYNTTNNLIGVLRRNFDMDLVFIYFGNFCFFFVV